MEKKNLVDDFTKRDTRAAKKKLINQKKSVYVFILKVS